MRDPFIKVPFADSGDKTAVPNNTQPDGSISFQQGWGNDYTLEVGVDPAAKSVDRGHMNQLLNIMTGLLNRWQTETFPEWIDSTANGGTPYPYPLGSIVRYPDGSGGFVLRSSLQANNTATPSAVATTAQWGDPLPSQNLKQATEALLGISSVANQAETEAGTNDSKFITPKKLRFGFSALFNSLGYLVFPSWLGGWIVQWGSVSAGAGSPVTFNYPLAFPTDSYIRLATVSNNTAGFATSTYPVSNSQMGVFHSAGSPQLINFLAIGR